MIKVSDLAAKAISASSRTFLSRFLHNGTEISGDVRSVITYKGSCGESAFTPGAVYSSYIDVVIDNCQESLSGKELTYQIGVVIDENTTEWYDIGKYTVHKPSTNVYTTSFTALGRISAKLGMMYQSKLTFPATIKNILNEISQNTGISIDASAFDTTGIIEKEINGYMYREVLAIIAGIFFAYVTEDTAGNIVFANYKNANVIATDGDRTSVLPTFADTDTEITGVRVVGGEIIVKDPETGGDVYQDQTFISGNANVAIQNEFMTQALFDANNGNVTGYTYRPATVSISLGDFRIEPFDSLQVTDSLGVVRTVPCMSIIHRFDGGITTDIVAPELQDTDDSGTAFKGMFSQAIQRFQHDLISVKNLLAGTVTAEEIKANYATIENLNAANANIQKLQTDKLDASTADLKYATISNLQAAVGRISKLETDSLTAESAVIKALQTDKLDALAADLKYATITNLNAAVGRISKLETDSLTVESAIIKSLQADKLDVSSADLKYATITNLNAAVGRISKLEADSLTVESAVIKNLQADKLSAAEAELQYATITNLDAALGRISTLETDSLTAESAEIKALQTDKLDATSADLKYATISSLNATNANITKLQSEKATVEQLEAVDGKIDDLTSKAITTENLSASVAKLGYATIQELEVEKATIAELEIGYAKINIMEANIATIHKSLEADYFTAKEIEVNFATISNLNAAVGRISTLETNSLTANSAVIKALQTDKLNASAADLKYATISNLEAAVGRINNLETSSLTSESAIIKALQTGVADIETLIFGSATGTVIQTSFSNAVIARLGNAQIKSAMIDSLSADKITSGSINTNNVSIQSADGSMVIADNTIQIKDGGTVRVQIGKDASGNYSIVICDTSGNVMFNTSGITENAIKSAIIRDGMVASNANISASKLNIDSLFTEINNSTKTIKSTKIFVDDEKQTLDIVFKEMASSVDNLGEVVSAQGTQISAIQGQITSKIWQQDIDTVKNSLDESIDTLSTNYSTLNQTVSGLNSTVASHTSQIASKADKSTVTTVSNKVSTLEQSLEGFKTTVSETYQTKNDMSKYSTTAQMNSSIEQKANRITSTVEKTYQKTVSKGEQLITNGNGLMGDNTNFSAWIFDGAIANNSAGSFTKAAGSAGTYTTDEYFPVNPTNEYTFSLDAKSAKGIGKLYSMLMFFDTDKQQISAGNHIYNAASTTTLAKDLKAGDTTIYLTSAAGWSTTYSYGFYMTVWNYKNSFGYTYPECTYSRNRLTLPKNGNYLNSANLNKTANTITLTTAYSGATIPAGTKVSQGGDGATYKYFPCSNTIIPTAWTSYSGKISGVDYSGQNKAGIFPPGTAYAKVGFLWNYQGSGNGEQQWITNLSVTDTSAASKAQAAADKAQTDVNALSTRVTQTESSITSQASSISSLGTRISTVEQTASGLTISLQDTNAEIDKISSIKYLTTNYSYPLATLKSYAKDGTNAGTWAVTSSAGVRVGDTVYLRMTNSDTGSYVYLALTVQSVPNATSVNGISHGFIDPGAIDVANTAKTSAANAAKTATNYLKFDSSGLLVGDMTASTLGKNVLIYSGGVNIRSGTTVLASFQADKIQLGNNSTSSVIEFCGGKGVLKYENISTLGDTFLALSSEKVAITGTNAVLHAINEHGERSKLFLYPKIAVLQSGTNTITVEAANGIRLAGSTSFVNTITFDIGAGVSQANAPGIKWDAINSKNPYIGYATDQTDGTFVWSITGTNYASGLAIGGGSGNLLYKGNNVLNAGNYTSYAPPKNHASADTTYGLGSSSKFGHVMLSDSVSSALNITSGYAATPAAVKAAYDKANHSHPYSSLSGDNTFTGKNIFEASNSYNTVATQKFVVGNSSSAFVFGGDGLQCFSGTASTTPKIMYINYYGGDVQIGGSGIANTTVKGNATVNGGSGDTPLQVNSAAAGSYIGFGGTSTTRMGFLGFSGVNVPVFYHTTSGAKELLHAGNYSSYAATHNHVHAGQSIQPSSIELNANGALSGYGGFIDFHFNGSTADYTSRIIESASGTLKLNSVTITGSTITGSLNGNATTATKAISDQNGKQIDRIYCSMVPAGTNIPANADLNTTAYIKVGNYYCSSNANAATLKNSPITVAFMMQVYSPLSTTIDNETTGTYVYRIRKLINYATGDEYVQRLQSSATAGVFTYGAWTKIIRNTDSPSFADLTISGNLYLSTNSNSRMYAKDLNGTYREILRINNSSTPTLVIGDGLYTAGIGITNIGAGTEVKLITKNDRVILENSTDTTYSAFFRPYTNGKCTLGTSANRWYAVYAAASTIYTSDAREKESIMPLGLPQLMPVGNGAVETDIHSELFDRLKPVQYRFIDGNGKICYGLIAQDVIESMHEIGIDENQLDLVHHDFWDDKETGQKKDTYGLGYNNLIALLIHEVQKLKKEIKHLKGEQLC